MSRFHTRGRDPWSSRGTPRHYQLPMAGKPLSPRGRGAGERADPAIRFTTFAGLAIALAALFYFGGQILVRGWHP